MKRSHRFEKNQTVAAALRRSNQSDDFIQSKFMKLGENSIHYIDEGHGDAVLLLHGLGADVRRWYPLLHRLAATRRVIAVDLLGFGQSSKPNMFYRGRIFVDQVAAVLDELSIGKISLIGNSMGGWISLLFAERFPQRVQRMVLLAPAFVFGLPNTVDAEKMVIAASPRTYTDFHEYFKRMYFRVPEHVACQAIQEEIETKRAFDDRQTIRSVVGGLTSSVDSFTTQRLQAIETEVSIIHGRQDRLIPVDASRKLNSILPNSTLSVLEECGHWPQLEQLERVFDLIELQA